MEKKKAGQMPGFPKGWDVECLLADAAKCSQECQQVRGGYSPVTVQISRTVVDTNVVEDARLIVVIGNGVVVRRSFVGATEHKEVAARSVVYGGVRIEFHKLRVGATAARAIVASAHTALVEHSARTVVNGGVSIVVARCFVCTTCA